MEAAQTYRYGLWLLNYPLMTTASHTQQNYSTPGSAEIKKLEDEIATLKSSIHMLQTDIETLKSTISKQTEDLNRRKQQMEQNVIATDSSGRKVMCTLYSNDRTHNSHSLWQEPTFQELMLLAESDRLTEKEKQLTKKEEQLTAKEEQLTEDKKQLTVKETELRELKSKRREQANAGATT
jgi:predicted  nucleic acid-binding Zn-ribbon protein